MKKLLSHCLRDLKVTQEKSACVGPSEIRTQEIMCLNFGDRVSAQMHGVTIGTKLAPALATMYTLVT